jgi:hypothetical protein
MTSLLAKSRHHVHQGLLLLVMAAMLGACSDDSAVVPDGGGNKDSAVDAQKDGTNADQKLDDSAVKDSSADIANKDSSADSNTADGSADSSADGSLTCAVPSIKWGGNGGLVLYRDESMLTDCATFKLTREDFRTTPISKQSCTTTIDAQNAALKAALATFVSTEVQQALKSGTPFYGKDQRPVDGVAFQIVVGSTTLLIGSACNGASGCVTIPTGLRTLQTQLLAITQEQRNTAPCSALKNP